MKLRQMRRLMPDKNGDVLDEIRREVLRIEPFLQREGLLESFQSKLNSKLSRRLAVDDFWVNDLLLKASPYKTIEGEILRDIIVMMESRVYTHPQAILIALLTSNGYEVRIYDDISRSGIALLAEDYQLEGIEVLRRFPDLQVEGEITEVEESIGEI